MMMAPLENVATGLASLGRFEDNYIVHASEGETVIPKEVLDANPKLKSNLFKQMKAVGIENPESYVVGNELNSRNPVTGQPEFFFKGLKKFLPTIGAIACYQFLSLEFDAFIDEYRTNKKQIQNI